MSPVQIQKALFLFSQEVDGLIGAELYSFEPYDYGPFDAAIYVDLRRLMHEGRVRGEWSPGRGWKNYMLTGSGRNVVPTLEKEADPRLTDFLRRTVEWVTERSFSDLLRGVYAAYPEFAVNSVFRGR